jgi:hypothetical protein
MHFELVRPRRVEPGNQSSLPLEVFRKPRFHVAKSSCNVAILLSLDIAAFEPNVAFKSDASFKSDAVFRDFRFL